MAAAAAAVFCDLMPAYASSPTWLCAVSAVFQLLTIRFLFHD